MWKTGSNEGANVSYEINGLANIIQHCEAGGPSEIYHATAVDTDYIIRQAYAQMELMHWTITLPKAEINWHHVWPEYKNVSTAECRAVYKKNTGGDK